MTPAFAVAEVLGALIAGQRAQAARESLLRFDAHLADFDTHMKPRTQIRALRSSKPASSAGKNTGIRKHKGKGAN